VTVPEDVLGLLADLREMLQDTMEPPVYVSDRRLVKAIALLKVPPSPAGCPCCASAEPHAVHLAPPLLHGHVGASCALSRRHLPMNFRSFRRCCWDTHR